LWFYLKEGVIKIQFMKRYIYLLFVMFYVTAFSQDDLLSLLGEEKTKDIATAAFKTNRVINGHSIENTAKGVLDFKINHRFGPVNGGFYNLFGLDQAFVRFGFDYGITDKLMVGLGRNSYDKVYDGFVKYRIIRQQTGLKNIPISISYLANMDWKTQDWNDEALDGKPWLRAFYTHQLLIARKFSEGTTVQLMPTLVHRNLVKTAAEKNDVFLLGVAARQKLTKRIAVNVEYTHALPNQLADNFTNTLSVGFDIETGGHVFQLFFTNSNGTDHRSFLTEATQSWKDGAIRFGFNVSRVFTVVQPKELKR
jgi:hypothetical protein